MYWELKYSMTKINITFYAYISVLRYYYEGKTSNRFPTLQKTKLKITLSDVLVSSYPGAYPGGLWDCGPPGH